MSKPKGIASHRRLRWPSIQLDWGLFIAAILLSLIGLCTLYSASNGDHGMMTRQLIHLLTGLLLMLALAQVKPSTYYQIAPYLFGLIILCLLAVVVVGHIGKGAQRWLNLGLFKFQPSELLKIAMPLFLAWYLSDKPIPPRQSNCLMALLMLAIPIGIVALQPDLGTAIVVAITGFCVIFLAGIDRKFMLTLAVGFALSLPLGWHFMHQYQRNRVLIFLNPSREPLGAGYHIIQSKIAIGSGGLLGKGWLEGTQSHLKFLPEHTTDFIFSVFSEEFGFLGFLLLMSVFLWITWRGVKITIHERNYFEKLFAASLTVLFFISFTINLGMVTGLLPVVGIPLPLISYGGSATLMIMALFGMLMSISTHKKLLD